MACTRIPAKDWISMKSVALAALAAPASGMASNWRCPPTGRAIHIYANGPVRAIFELRYEPWDAGNGVKVAERKRFIVDAGQQLDEIQSTFDFTPAPSSDGTLTVAIGLTEHPAAADVQVKPDERGKLHRDLGEVQRSSLAR